MGLEICGLSFVPEEFSEDPYLQIPAKNEFKICLIKHQIKAHAHSRQSGTNHCKSKQILPLEIICDIFSFLSVENLLEYNWTCLRLFNASQILYRPLQRPHQQRVIQNLYILVNSYRHRPSASTQFDLRMLENNNEKVYVRKYTFQCRCRENRTQNTNVTATALTDDCQHAIRLSYEDKCWPDGPLLLPGLPTAGPPSDVVGIERIELNLSGEERQRNVDEEGSCLRALVSKIPHHNQLFLTF